MFELQASPRLYPLAGLILLLAQLSLFVFGTPPFQMGVFYESEPELAAIFIFGFLGSLWLAWGLHKQYLKYTPPGLLWRILLLWTLWQVLAIPFASSLWRTWFGPPETGEGVAHFLALLLLTLITAALWRKEPCRRVILAVAALDIILQCLLHILNPEPKGGYAIGTWVPGLYPFYLAFMAGFLWIATTSAGMVKTRAQYALLVLFTLAVLYVSRNKTAEVLLPAAMLASGIASALSRKAAFASAGAKWRALMVAACFLPVGWIAFSGLYGGSVGLVEGGGLFDRVLHKEDGLGSRVALNQVAIAAMRHEPRRWLAGSGWGRFTDDIFTYALVDGVYVYRNAVRRPNWTPLEGSTYHSHSQPLEVLLSLGLPGLALWFAFPVLALRRLPREVFWACAPMLVAMIMLYYFWFETTQCLAYDALLLAALLNACEPTPPGGRNGRPAAVLILLCGFALLGSAWEQARAIAYGQTLTSATRNNQPYTDFTKEWVAGDLERGGDRLYTIATGYGAQIESLKAIGPNERGWYAGLMDVAHYAATLPSTGSRMASLELWMQYKLLIDFGGFRSFADLAHQAVVSMPEVATQLCRRVPLRDDYETMFLVNLPAVTHNDTGKQEEILKGILASAPGHRPAEWLLGRLYLLQPDHAAEGKALMKDAALRGVDKIFPVTDKQLQDALQP